LPVRDEDGKIVKWFGTCTDIHEQKMIEEELRRARDAAESANYLKSAFVANMSHEVRTPLGVILGFADLLADPTTTQEERRSYNEILKRNGEQLSVIINDILDLSKVEAGQLSIEVEEFSVESLVDEVTDSFSMRAIEKGIQVRAEFIGSWPVDFAGDMIRIRQVLMNLVSNAVKFTHKGEVVVRVREEEGDLVIEVSDTGVGIAPEKQDKLFCAFSQADESITRKYGGTGLGLALSLKLAQLMKGSLVLGDSVVGSGSVFRLRLSPLPLTQTSVAASDLISLPPSSTQITPSSLSGLRVLLVDDSIDNQFIIGRILRKNEAIVETANNGLEGIERALAGQFDVVLMDIQMPVLDGYSAVMRLKERGYDRPIIALTAHALTEMRRKCLAIGCCAHLTKPIEPDILITTVAEFARAPAVEKGLRLVERVQA
jgi:CheY-like chemotaxis protein